MKLNELRAKKRLSQWDLRLLTDIHQSKISLMESGYILPTAEESAKLAKALGVDQGDMSFEIKHLDTPCQPSNENTADTSKRGCA